MKELLAAQPPPAPAEGDVWAEVIINAEGYHPPALIVDMRARREQGISKYGGPLQVGNERSMKADAYQEALDGVVYAYGRAIQLYAEENQEGGDVWIGISEDFARLAEGVRRAP